MEAVATGLLCYLSGLIDTTIGNFGTSQGAAYAGVTNIFLLTLFIMAAGPGSGGHVRSSSVRDMEEGMADVEPGEPNNYVRNHVDRFDWLLAR